MATDGRIDWLVIDPKTGIIERIVGAQTLAGVTSAVASNAAPADASHAKVTAKSGNLAFVPGTAPVATQTNSAGIMAGDYEVIEVAGGSTKISIVEMT